ncbi:VOC family protein [Pseudofulvibacter geojedonensis]|uniref:VOC family protein n=1 Tax=Pseudofulvibacter geojedonensis TaxID=1123758 RepID=A0ABW3HZE0_9FLAO
MKKIIPLLILSTILVNCTNSKVENDTIQELNLVKKERDNLQENIHKVKASQHHKIASFLTFQEENAEQAMNFYINLFNNSKVISLKRWGKNSSGKEGSIMHATFKLNNKLFMCSDSPIKHNWDFTPAVSNYVECENEQELSKLFIKLSEKGKVMMPLNNYGFSTKFGFVEDQFGVSWQLNLK